MLQRAEQCIAKLLIFGEHFGSEVKASASNAGDPGSIPGSTPVFLPGESHGRRSLVGYSPWGRKESDTTERLHLTFTFHLEASPFTLKRAELFEINQMV